MNNNKKICVIGGGRWGKNHLKTLHRLNSLSAIVDNNQSLLCDLKKIYPDVLFFSSIEETFSHKFSGYVIATPAPTHFKIAKTVIERGFPVLIEKPMTLNVADAQNVAEQEKKRLMQNKNIKSVTLMQKIGCLNDIISEKKSQIGVYEKQFELSTKLLNDLEEQIIKEKEEELAAKEKELKTNKEAIRIGCDNKSN